MLHSSSSSSAVWVDKGLTLIAWGSQHAIKRSDWVLAWNKPKQRSPVCPPLLSRRNPGRNDGETWMSSHYVSGRAMDPVWDGGERDEV